MSRNAAQLKDMIPDGLLDCFGLACPMPIYKTATVMKNMQSGQVLDVRADDDGIEKDMPAWCKATGNEYLGLLRENGEYRVFVKKK